MGKKLQKYLDEAEKTEQQIAELEERLKTIRAAQKKEEDSEIIRAIRSTKMGGRELLALLDNIQAGNVTFLTAVNNASEEAETEEGKSCCAVSVNGDDAGRIYRGYCNSAISRWQSKGGCAVYGAALR